jgi:hypothetical protein
MPDTALLAAIRAVLAGSPSRPHSGIASLTPWQRLNNLLGNDT